MGEDPDQVGLCTSGAFWGDGCVGVDCTRVDFSADCGRRVMGAGWATGVPGTWVPGVHSVCAHNELSSLLMRTMGPVPEQVWGELGDCVKGLWARIRRLARRYPGQRWTLEETAMSYSGRLRRRYLAAAESLALKPLEPTDGELKPFLKAEKVWCGTKRVKPRMIFPRSPRYNLVLASYLKGFEHWLWGRLTLKSLGLGRRNTRLVMKGLGPRARASVLSRKFRSFPDCVVFEVDGKGFEAHVGASSIKAEHSVYRSAFPGSRDLGDVLRVQERLVGKTQFGIRFHRPGGRASGDFNTGMGNTLVMVADVAGVLHELGVDFDLAVDGDNALVFISGVDSDLVLGTIADRVVATSGQELTLESPCRSFQDIRFGQCAPVLCPTGGWVMVRDPRAVLSKALCSHKHFHEPKGALRYMKGVFQCELSLARGLPVVQAWCLEGLRALEHVRRLGDEAYADWNYAGAWFAESDRALPVRAEVREAYSRSFGLSPEEQLQLEAGFRFDLSSPWRSGTQPEGCWWDASPGIAEAWADARW